MTHGQNQNLLQNGGNTALTVDQGVSELRQREDSDAKKEGPDHLHRRLLLPVAVPLGLLFRQRPGKSQPEGGVEKDPHRVLPQPQAGYQARSDA